MSRYSKRHKFLMRNISHQVKSLRKEYHSVPESIEPSINSVRKNVIIYKSELDYISRCILDYPHCETGGQLFGFYTNSGIPVVLYAIGPGRNANHQVAFFNQDLDYLVRIGNQINEYLGLHHIGEWHSHHQLGLARPSEHDARTMISTIREKNLGHFLLCIGNCNNSGETSLNPFLCDDKGYSSSSWDIIYAESPIRRPADRLMVDELQQPIARRANHRDDHARQHTTTTPQYAEGYWMKDKKNNNVLRRIQTYLRDAVNLPSDPAIRLDKDGLLHICSSGRICNGKQWEEDILFPAGFPSDSPVITRRISGITTRVINGNWYYSGDIIKSFIDYYSKN